eukprot:9488987-Alexandrium_andersonii.AAC.1
MTSAQAVAQAKKGGTSAKKNEPKPNSSAKAVQQAKQATGSMQGLSNVSPEYPEASKKGIYMGKGSAFV